MFIVNNLIEINRAEEQRARQVLTSILYSKQSTQRLARFAPHCVNEADSAKNPTKHSISKALGNLQCGADAKRASAHFAAFDSIALTSIGSLLSEPFAPLRDKKLYDNQLPNQKL